MYRGPAHFIQSSVPHEVASDHPILINSAIDLMLLNAQSPRIVIIGAGAAGMAAASSLFAKGFTNLVILEAQDSIGGRINTTNLGTYRMDLGAHWIHGEDDNVVFEMASKRGLTQNSGDFENVEFVCDDGTQLDTAIGTDLSVSFDSQAALGADDSLEDTLVKWCIEKGSAQIQDEKTLDAFIKWYSKFSCTVEGSDRLSEVSTAGLTHYKKCPGDSLISWKFGGYDQLFKILTVVPKNKKMSKSSLESKIVFKTIVKTIDWKGLTALVSCTNGKMYKADHVILTVPLGVLKEKHYTLFSPPLPTRKMEAINCLGFGTVDKIYLKFNKPWWPTECSGFSFLRKNEAVNTSWVDELVGFYVESHAPNVLGGWLVGDAARAMEADTDESVISGCVSALQQFVGKKYEVVRPVAMVRSKWFMNQFARGSYSFRSVSSEAVGTSHSVLAEPLINTYKKKILFFAGEATHPHFYSTVHGAVETGWREAERISSLYLPSSSL